jgi:hypothetical protein
MTDKPQNQGQPPLVVSRREHDAFRARMLLTGLQDKAEADTFLVPDQQVWEWMDELYEIATRHLMPQADYDDE